MLFLFVLVVGLLPHAALAQSPAALATSYALCTADPTCAARFGLAGSEPSAALEAGFDQELALALGRHPALADALLGPLEECLAANATAPPPCTTQVAQWAALLHEASPCPHPNQVWQAGHGCVCAYGKHCDDCSVGIAVSDLWSFIVLLALLVLFTALGFVWNLNHTSAIERSIIGQRTQETSALHQNTAALRHYGVSTVPFH